MQTLPVTFICTKLHKQKVRLKRRFIHFSILRFGLMGSLKGVGMQDIVSNFDWARVLTEELYLETYDPLTVDWQNILRAPNLTKVHFGAGQQLEFENIQCLTRSVLETRHLQVFMTVHYCPGFTKKTWKYLESVGLSVYCDDDNCYVGPRQED